MGTFVTDNLLEDVSGTSLALGFFDGVHIAHQKVLNDAISFSKKLGTKSCVLTYKNHPIELLYYKKSEFITTPEERLAIFEKMGFDVVIMADFTKDIAHMQPKDYLQNIIMHTSPRTISVGYNHRFGTQKSGDMFFLSECSQEFDYILSVVPPVKFGEIFLSSTHIKELIKSGLMENVNELLNRRFSIKNVVTQGMQRGRAMNFPTANLEFPDRKIIPKFGSYVGIATVDGQKYNAVANVGIRPTFSDINEPLLEVHILDFTKDIYNKELEFEFIKIIREELIFHSMDELSEQIKVDIKKANEYFNS